MGFYPEAPSSGTATAIGTPPVTVTGTPSSGQVLTAMSQAAADWQTPSAGAVSGRFLAAPSSYAPAASTPLSVTSASTLTAFDSGTVSTGTFIAPASGTVKVTASFVAELTGTVGGTMTFALCETGTTSPVYGNMVTFRDTAASIDRPVVVEFIVTGLTSGDTYDLDLMGATTAPNLVIQAWGTQVVPGSSDYGAPVTMTVQAV